MEEIVKYKNRKMYSRAQKTYVTLHDVKDTVQRGKLVRVTDYNGNDITASILAKVVVLTDAPVGELETLIGNN